MTTDRRNFLASIGSVSAGMLLLSGVASAADESQSTEELELELTFLKDQPVQKTTHSITPGRFFSFMTESDNGNFHVTSGLVRITPDKQYALELGLYSIQKDKVVLKMITGEEPLVMDSSKVFSPRTPIGEVINLRLSPKVKAS